MDECACSLKQSANKVDEDASDEDEDDGKFTGGCACPLKPSGCACPYKQSAYSCEMRLESKIEGPELKSDGLESKRDGPESKDLPGDAVLPRHPAFFGGAGLPRHPAFSSGDVFCDGDTPPGQPDFIVSPGGGL